MCCPRYPGKYRLFAVTNRRRRERWGKWGRKGRRRRRGIERINRTYFIFIFIISFFFITDFLYFLLAYIIYLLLSIFNNILINKIRLNENKFDYIAAL